MTTTVGTTIAVYAHYTYKPTDAETARFFDNARPTYATGILGWSNPITAKTNGPVVLELGNGMYTDQPFRDAILTPALANHYGMTLVTKLHVSDEERALYAAAQAAGFALSEFVD